MIQKYRKRFNEEFSQEKYQKLLFKKHFLVMRVTILNIIGISQMKLMRQRK